MSEPSWDTVCPSEQLADTPAVCRDGRWWLVAPSGALSVDEPALVRELDSLAADLDAANWAVAQLRPDGPDQGLG